MNVVRGPDGRLYAQTPNGFVPVPEEATQAPSNPITAPLAALAAKEVGKYAAKAIGGSLASGAGSAAASAIPTQFPGLFAQTALPSLAEGAAASGAAASGAAGASSVAGASTLGTIANAAPVALPLVVGPLLDQMFFASKPKRQFNAEEIAQDPKGANYLANQIPGYDKMSQAERASLLTQVKDSGANLIALPGYADKEGNTQKRGSEFINWARYMRPWRIGDDTEMQKGKKWYEGTASDTPAVEEIDANHRLTQKKKDELKLALSAIQGGRGEASDSAVAQPIPFEGTPMPRGGVRDAMYIAGRDGPVGTLEYRYPAGTNFEEIASRWNKGINDPKFMVNREGPAAPLKDIAPNQNVPSVDDEIIAYAHAQREAIKKDAKKSAIQNIMNLGGIQPGQMVETPNMKFQVKNRFL